MSEVFDVVRAITPLPAPVTTNDGAVLPSVAISLHAIERGIDITLTPAAEDCPPADDAFPSRELVLPNDSRGCPTRG